MIAADIVRNLMAPLVGRVRHMISRAVLDLVNDALKTQAVQFHAYGGAQVQDGIERFMEYGFTSNPFPGAECVVLALGGSRDHSIVIATQDKRYRLTGLQSGEVALHDDQGQQVYFRRTGIDVVTPLKLRLEGDTVEIVAHTTLRHDIGGYADEMTYEGGSDWKQTTWQQGAAVTPVQNAVTPPEHFNGP